MTIPVAKMPDKIAEIQFANGIWTDVTNWLLDSIIVNRGSTRVDSPAIRYEPGKGTIKLNNADRRFDPTNLLGPYTAGGKSQVTPMRPLRIKMVWQDATYVIFNGFVDFWDISWVSDIYSEATVPATDGFKILSNKRRVAVAPVGSGELSGARVTRILNSAGWPAGDRVIGTGVTNLQSTDLSGDALSELLNVAETEIGEFYIAADGRATFRDRNALFLDTRSSTPQGLFGVFKTMPGPYTFKLNTDDSTLWNEIIATRAGGTTQTVSDSASIAALQFAKTFERSSLLHNNDLDTGNWASWILYVSKDPEVRFDAITIYPMKDPDYLFDQVLGREIGDRITCAYQPSGSGEPIVRDAFIRGVSHVIGQQSWTTTWTLQSASKYGTFLTLDDPIYGMLDVGNAYGF